MVRWHSMKTFWRRRLVRLSKKYLLTLRLPASDIDFLAEVGLPSEMNDGHRFLEQRDYLVSFEQRREDRREDYRETIRRREEVRRKLRRRKIRSKSTLKPIFVPMSACYVIGSMNLADIVVNGATGKVFSVYMGVEDSFFYNSSIEQMAKCFYLWERNIPLLRKAAEPGNEKMAAKLRRRVDREMTKVDKEIYSVKRSYWDNVIDSIGTF